MTDQPRARTVHRRPGFAQPPGACDCHMHVFGPFDRFPLAAERSYTPPEASLAEYRQLQRQTGLERVVFVQPSVYGTDNRCMLAAMEELGPSCRGVAVIDPTIDDAELTRFHAAGVRGVRVNIGPRGADDAAATAQRLERIAARIQPLGWHLQIFAPIALIGMLAETLGRLPVALVIDHVGLPQAARGLEQPGFAALLALVAAGRCWVKLSGYYRVADDDTMPAALPFARALASAAPDRMVWGSDWPHTGSHRHEAGAARMIGYRDLDSGDLLDLLRESVPDATVLRQVLVDNPARLYGF